MKGLSDKTQFHGQKIVCYFFLHEGWCKLSYMCVEMLSQCQKRDEGRIIEKTAGEMADVLNIQRSQEQWRVEGCGGCDGSGHPAGGGASNYPIIL